MKSLVTLKRTLTRVGARCSLETIRRMNSTLNYLEVGWWMKQHGFDSPRRYETRYELFDLVAEDVGAQNVLYLEFGVYEGESMRYWSNLLTNPSAKLHGFDSFEGLPAAWNLGIGKGHFNAGGQIPVFSDQRVQLLKGWFEETLPKYVWPDHEALMVTLDADLYSSTLYALNFVRDMLRPGSYVYFDEFADRSNELRAFDEFLTENGLQFRLVGASQELQHVLFQRSEG